MSTTIQDITPSQRPRERLLSLGAGALSDAELVALLLGNGRRGAGAVDMAQELLRDNGGLQGLASARVEELGQHPGVGPAKATRLVAALALSSRLTSPPERLVVRTSADLARVVVPLLARERSERLVVVVLDGGHHVRRVEEAASGAVDRTPLPLRELLSLVLRHDGVAFAIAHNHPGGTTTPSDADRRGTAALRSAADHVGLRLLDHLVVAGPKWSSISGTD